MNEKEVEYSVKCCVILLRILIGELSFFQASENN